VVVLSEVQDADEAAHIVNHRLIPLIRQPHQVDGAELHVSCSVGIAMWPEDGADVDTLMRNADAAMYQAKAAGKDGARFFSAEMTERAHARLALEAQLRRAVEAGDQFELRWQPRVDAANGRLIGAEGLIRWHHPERGLVAPGVFLPALERAGLLEKLGVVILHDALQAITRWDKAGLTVPHVSVNFSAEELRSPQLPERIKWALDRFHLEPGRLTVEILESVVAQTDNDMIVRNIASLSDMGCGIDLDDFGTGQTSLANIRRFALRRLKIDRSFVTRIDEDPGQQRVCSAIISLAERLGLETVAEGVETSGEQAMLARLGFTHAQGFGIGRPMPFEEIAEWMARHRARLAGLSRLRKGAALS
jgi:predicted signal transduction protein with EAL and GGDEF domain